MTEIRAYLSKATENFFNVPTLRLSETSEGVLIDFIHNPRVYLLQACVSEQREIILYADIQVSANKSIIFYKTSAVELTQSDAVNDLNIITLTNSAAESLYQIIRHVYTPMLTIGDDLFSIKLQKTLLELESNLKLVTHGEGDENIKVILSVEDEVGYWKAFGEKRDIKKSEREAASAFCVLFEDICEEIRCLPSISLQEVRDSAENIGGILDDVWRYTSTPYSQDRMAHMFDIIGHVICSVIQQAVSRTDLWRVHYGMKDNEILHQLTEALTAVKVWVSTCKTLTDTYWPNYSLHEWKGKPYVPVFCQNFQKRLEEIHSIRSTFNQLSKLLTKSERTELNSDQLLEPFQNINVWIYNGHNQMWENAVSRFSSSIRPAEAKIAEKLKPRLQNLSTKQSLYEFSRYRTLLSRPLVQQALTRELELFLSSLLTMMKDVKTHLEEDLPGLYRPPEMTDLVVKVQWARQMEDKTTDSYNFYMEVKEIESCVGTDLRNLEGSDEVLQLASKVQNDLKNTYKQLYEEWSRDVQAQLRAGSLQLSERPVVEFSSADRLMVVNYPEGLERVEREARALLAAGLPPPPGALTGLTASLRYARALHQVASFHNTLGERAVSSTRPMLLRAALQLANLVADNRPPSWSDERALHEYTQQLKEKVMELEKQNNYLTSQHLKIRSIVEKLMDTELLARLADWKKGIKDIRDIIEKVEANGYENTEMWRSHWDLQLYKAMECQYMKALLSLHSHFPALRVDLVLRSGRVRSQPSEEELRARLYSLLRRLVTLPAALPGLASTTDTDTNTTSVFSSIVEKHSWLGNKAVSQLEGTLANLERTCERWTRRAALGCVRLKDLCDQLTSPEHWEVNFRACKAYGQTVAKMTFEDEKIEWITVGTVTLRREFEAQARNLWACLMTSLTTSCRADSTALDSFMTAAAVMLEDKTLPKNTKELAEISAKQQALQMKMPEMEKMVEDLKRKSYLARTWGGDTTLDGVTREWNKLKETMTAQQAMFEHQAEIVKTTLTGDCENLRSSLEAWSSRWSRHEVHDTTYDGLVAASNDVKHALDGWKTLADQWDELRSECEKFNINPDMSEAWKEAEQLKTNLTTLWTPFEQYNEEYESLAGQKWIVFQRKLHQLDDFVSKWEGELEPFTSVTLIIKRELDKYSELTVALKYLRGSDFTEKHWRDVFGLLGMEYVPVEELTLGRLLAAGQDIKKHMKTLQKINSSASSEAAVRSALTELELWYEGARLTIEYYTDRGKKDTPLVRDYKEMIEKVEEQQWIVAGLGGRGHSAGWEGTLGDARGLLEAARKAQRR
ncbi:unnamed protein product [Danaus chrysippus]|uniref:(African queen) hypothetical protein n=1 Tax=Danaus chrysippus TaxID=151541 RepID=A0A8J2QIG7_9NEOP|nr:unnamed protein product [Danaus chrysippus]